MSDIDREIDIGENHRITLHLFNPNSDKILICFPPRGGGRMAKRGFGTLLCEKYAWNQIYVDKTRHSEFRHLSLSKFYDAVSPYLRGMDVISYGSSIGGYAALYFGGTINARILAASPRNSSHPILSGNLDNTDNFNHIKYLSEVPASSHSPYILYDTRQAKDHRMVENWVLPAYPTAKIIDIPNSGHRSLEKLKKSGTLSTMIKSFVEAKFIDRVDIEPKEGTDLKLLDDALQAYLVGDYKTALVTLSDFEINALQKSNLLPVYIDSLEKTESTQYIYKLRTSYLSGRVDANSIKPIKLRNRFMALIEGK